MMPWHRQLVLALWLLWLIYWRVSAVGVKPARRVQSPLSRTLHIAPLVLAGLLLWIGPMRGAGLLFQRFLARSAGAYWCGLALLVLGLGFSIWARMTLGRNWSASVTVKHDHQLICTGPYAWVRHPIYSGVLLAFIGTAVVRGDWCGVLAVLIVLVTFWRKLRLEERWMIETFGDDYRRYRQRTAALIPLLL